MPIEVADTWFETRRVSDGLTLIWEPHVDPNVRCNMWHVRGRDRDLLLDSGMGVRPLRREVALLAERDVVCVASHSHFDHVGGHHEFATRLMHGAEADIMASPTPQNTVADGYLEADIFYAHPYAGFDQAAYTVRAAPATGLVDEGDVIDLGDRALRVLHLPGHSPGEIGILEDATGIFFGGDAIYDGELFDTLYHSVPADYAATMERIRELPIEVLHGGHGPSCGRARVVEITDEYLAGRRRPGCPLDD